MFEALKELGRRVSSTGVYLGCKFALGQFMKQDLDPSGRRGWIVNVSSMLGMVGITGGFGENELLLPRLPQARS